MKILKIAEEQDIDIKIAEETTICPFCKSGNYDLIGLKSHLLHGDCEIFNNLSDIRRIEF